MTLNEYQGSAKRTARYPNVGHNFVYPTLGLAGEAGEVAEKVKKAIRDDDGKMTDERRNDIAGELGDVLWYVSQVAAELNLTLDEVAEKNIAKLASRETRGKISGSGDNR